MTKASTLLSFPKSTKQSTGEPRAPQKGNNMPQIFKKQIACPNCGKLAKKHVKRYWGTEPYKGNLIVLSDRSYKQTIHRTETNDGIEQTQYYLGLWDGESYEMYCDYFCTNRCAQQFAKDAFEAGFRRTS